MKRDRTVIWSVVALLATSAVFSIFLSSPGAWDGMRPAMWLRLLGWVFAVANLRILILWIQAFVHCVRHCPRDSRLGWVVALILLGPIAGCLYYFRTKESAGSQITQQPGGGYPPGAGGILT